MWKLFTRDGAEKSTLTAPPVIVNPVARVLCPSAVVTNGVWTFLAYATEEIDTDNMVDLVAQNRRITIQHSGKYLVSATTTWAANASGGRGVRFVKNGAILYDGSGMEGGSISGFGPSSSAIIDCVAGDYLEMQVYQSSGGTINLGISTFQAAKIDGAVVTYVDVPNNFVGQELAYAETTVTVNPSGTTFATATTIITAPAITCDGISKINIEFSASYIKNPNVAAGDYMDLFVYEDGTQRARLAHWEPGIAGKYQSGKYSFEFIPTAGVHTYSIRGLVNQGSGSVVAGDGKLGNDIPANIRITKAT